MQTFEITGYPSGLTNGPAIVVPAKSDAEARAKVIAMLRALGCSIEADALSVSRVKHRLVETWP